VRGTTPEQCKQTEQESKTERFANARKEGARARKKRKRKKKGENAVNKKEIT